MIYMLSLGSLMMFFGGFGENIALVTVSLINFLVTYIYSLLTIWIVNWLMTKIWKKDFVKNKRILFLLPIVSTVIIHLIIRFVLPSDFFGTGPFD